MPLYKFQHLPIHYWSRRLHQIENESRRTIAPFVHNSYGWVVSVRNRIDLNLAVQDRIGVIQNRIHGMRGISISS